MEERLKQLEADVARLKEERTVSNFSNDLYVSIKNLQDFIEVVSAVPVQSPKNFFDQIKLYANAGTYRLYVYNYKNNVWNYVIMT